MDAHEELRPLMFSIAYRMTGSVGDAEDIVQEAFIRAYRAEAPGPGRVTPGVPGHHDHPAGHRPAALGAGPARVLRGDLAAGAAGRRSPGPAERAEMADSLSLAFLVLLESLSPVERAVFLLREVFGYGYEEIARTVGKSEPNCRQIFGRARRRIDEGRPRFEASRRQGAELTNRFLAAVGGGDMEPFIEMLAPDVVFYGDGGGKGPAITAPIYGRERVARLMRGLARRARSRSPRRCARAGQRAAWGHGLRRGREPVRRAGLRRPGRAGARDPLGGQPGQAAAPRRDVRRLSPAGPLAAQRLAALMGRVFGSGRHCRKVYP